MLEPKTEEKLEGKVIWDVKAMRRSGFEFRVPWGDTI